MNAQRVFQVLLEEQLLINDFDDKKIDKNNNLV